MRLTCQFRREPLEAASRGSATMNDKTATRLRFHSGEAGFLLVIFTSFIIYIFSEGARFGDATTYAKQLRLGALIEPGHLVWRPLGYVIGHALNTLDTYSSALWTLQGMCLAASVGGLVAIYVLCRNVARPGVALLISGLTAISNGYWFYAFSGCSYTFGILFQTIALTYAIKKRETTQDWRNAFAAGSFGGLAASAWAPNMLVAPAILAALITTTGESGMRVQRFLREACAVALGYLTTFALPLAFVYGYAGTQWRVGPTSSAVTFAQWLSSARHGVPVHIGLAQLLRAALGWAQSVISLSDLGWRLKLWVFGEGAFPFSSWALSLISFYVAVSLVAVILLRERSRLDVRARALINAAALAIGLNLAFGVAWQGTDLERYMPSWPFQMALLAVALNLLWQRADRAQFALMFAALVVLGIVNWQGTFKPVLAANSYRNIWVTAIRQHASRGDLVVIFGQRKSVIVSPHEENFPKINEISDEIEKGGTGWRSVEISEIQRTQSRGGKVFLGDSLFWLDSAPRDGWSFRENPVPTPREIRDTFLPFKGETVAFTVGRERVWIARTGGSP
jgi:hypothetical protein